MMGRIFSYIGREKLVSCFLLLVFASLCFHVSQRNNHFQESDSSMVYHVLQNFPDYALSKQDIFERETAKRNKALFSQETLRAVLDNSLVSFVARSVLGESYEGQIKEKVIASWGERTLLFYVRSAEIMAIAKMEPFLPHSLQTALELSLGSTYSFGHGLVYGLATSPQTGYEDFMSRNLIVTLLLFHLSVVLFFFTLMCLGLKKESAILSSMSLLFSMTLYSYAYSVGSPVWMVFTAFLYFWYAASKNFSDPKYLRMISLLTAVLVFFNYLVVFYWLATLLAYFFSQYRDILGRSFKKGWIMLKSQFVAIFSVLLCFVLFVPSGQAIRTTAESLSGFFVYSYYIVLNFVALFNQFVWFTPVQFILACVLMLCGCLFVYKRWGRVSVLSQYVYVLLTFAFMYFLAVLFGVLGFGPTRHVLFVAPLMFSLLAFGVEYLFRRFRFIMRFFSIFFVCFATVGFFALNLRSADVSDASQNILIDDDVDQIVLHDFAYQFLYQNWNTSKPTVELDNIQLKSGRVYFYVSQVTDFEDAKKELEQTYGELEVMSRYTKESEVRFLAFDPDFLNFNRTNSIYTAKFRIIKP